MRIFGKSTCMLCNGEAGITAKKIDGQNEICGICAEMCAFPRGTRLKLMDVNQVKDAYDKALQDRKLDDEFVASRSNSYIEIDDDEKLICFPTTRTRYRAPRIYSFGDIIQFEVVENGETITSGGLGRAIFGGAILGPLGAILGGITGGKKTKGICEQLELRIDINDINYPTHTIYFVTQKIKRKSFLFKQIAKELQETLSLMNYVAENATKADETYPSATESTANNLREFKALLDDGIITQEEFDRKKKELLN